MKSLTNDFKQSDASMRTGCLFLCVGGIVMVIGNACRIGMWEFGQLRTVECSMHGSPAAIGKVLLGYDSNEVKSLLSEGDLVLLNMSAWTSICYRRQLGKPKSETLSQLHNSPLEVFKDFPHVRHLYLLGSDEKWYYYTRSEAWHEFELQLVVPKRDYHLYRVFMVQGARTGDQTHELVGYESAQTPEEAAYLAARGSRLYRKRLIAVLCNSTEEPVLESHLKRWSVVDDKRRHEKPAYWRGLASTVEEALALAKVCWTNRTILKWDRSYRWCNPAAECVSEAV